MRRALIVALLAAALPAGSPSHAGDPPVCGHPWESGQSQTVRSCVFRVEGFPIKVKAEANASSNARVRVWVHVQNYPAPVGPGCEASGNTRASCETEIVPQRFFPPPAVPHSLLVCNVEGHATGTFECRSNTL